MIKTFFTLVICLGFKSLAFAQLSFSPELIAGHRSSAYMHQLNFTINNRLKLNNLSLFDTEYRKNKNNIYFIRNMLSYSINGNFVVNTAFGIKNPGSFLTSSIQFRLLKPNYHFSYSIGTTYQSGFSLEQALTFELRPRINENINGYFNVLAIGNLNNNGYIRGLQFLRWGLKERQTSYGFAMNLDQFDNAKKSLKNYGVFIKTELN